jgi:hypothetical protein
MNQKQGLTFTHDLDMKSEVSRFNEVTFIAVRPRATIAIEIKGRAHEERPADFIAAPT